MKQKNGIKYKIIFKMIQNHRTKAIKYFQKFKIPISKINFLLIMIKIKQMNQILKTTMIKEFNRILKFQETWTVQEIHKPINKET